MVKWTVIAFVVSPTTHAATFDPTDVIRAADHSRGGTEKGLVWTAEVESAEDGETSTRSYQVKAKAGDALVETLTPEKNKGEMMLFNDQNLWFFRNGLRKPVTLSRRPRLSGQAANGDIAATDYAGNYTATVLGEETVDGEAAYKLLLKSKNTNNTYDQIRYWISKGRRLALKAEFLTLQGETFKRAAFKYDNQLATGGATIPFISEMRIEDGEFKNNYSVIRYKNPGEKTLGHSIFNVGNLTN
jgi:hypothetical protein